MSYPKQFKSNTGLLTPQMGLNQPYPMWNTPNIPPSPEYLNQDPQLSALQYHMFRNQATRFFDPRFNLPPCKLKKRLKF